MIVNREHAEEAWVVITRRAPDPEEVGIHNMTRDDIDAYFRNASRFCHPDAPEGTLEKWAELDRAKHVLLRWLEKRSDAPAAPPMGAKCGNCGGKGYVERTAQRGFKLTTLRAQCRKCNGTGEEGVEQDTGDW